MLTTIIGAVINIILDPIFIFVLGMGVRGAALATVLSQAAGAFWILRFLIGKQTILHLKKENMKPDPQIFKPCLGLGISTFVMLSTESLLSISFTSSLARYGGDLAVGAMTIINSVCQLATMPLQGFCLEDSQLSALTMVLATPFVLKKLFLWFLESVSLMLPFSGQYLCLSQVFLPVSSLPIQLW